MATLQRALGLPNIEINGKWGNEYSKEAWNSIIVYVWLYLVKCVPQRYLRA